MADEDDELEKDLEKDDKTITSENDDFADRSSPEKDAELAEEMAHRDPSLDDPSRKPTFEPIIDNKEAEAAEPSKKEMDDATDTSDDLDQEFDQLPDKSDAGGPIKPPSNVERYQNFLNQYNTLLNQRNNSDFVAAMHQAGAKIGQSMAGRYSGQFNPGMEGYQVLKQMGDRPLTDFQQQQVVEGRQNQLQQQLAASDPTSPQSKLIRQYLNERVFKASPLPDDVSANDAMMLLKAGVGKPQNTHFQQLPVVNQQTGEKTMAVFNPATGTFASLDGKPLDQTWVRDYRAQSFVDPYTGERQGFSGGTGKSTGALTGPGINRSVPAPPTAGSNEPAPEIDRNLLTAHQTKLVDNSRKEFIKEIKDDRNNLYSTDRVIAALQAGKDLGDLPREDQDQLNRAFGQKGHLSNEQISTVLGKSDWANRLENVVSLGMNGKLTDENRQFLQDTLKVIRDQNEQFIKNRSNYYTGTLYQDLKSDPRLRKYNVSPQSAQKLLGLEGALQTGGGQSKPVVQKAYNKDKNQTWLKYGDGTSEIVDGQR